MTLSGWSFRHTPTQNRTGDKLSDVQRARATLRPRFHPSRDWAILEPVAGLAASQFSADHNQCSAVLIFIPSVAHYVNGEGVRAALANETKEPTRPGLALLFFWIPGTAAERHYCSRTRTVSPAPGSVPPPFLRIWKRNRAPCTRRERPRATT